MRHLKDLKKHLLLSGGATLSADNLDAVHFNGGYMVSVKGYEYKTTLSKLSKRLLNFYKAEALRLGAYVGLWIDNNRLYIDISYLISDKTQALAVARHNNQLAVYDNRNATSIYLNGGLR